MKIVYINKKTKFDFEFIKLLEAGIVLKGWEVKSMKLGNLSLVGSFVREINGELYLSNTRIGSYKFSQYSNKNNEYQDRKLLLKRREIDNITSQMKVAGVTAIPTKVFIDNKGLLKIEIAIAKGRKKFDKRSKLKENDLKRRLDQDRKFYKI